MKASLFLAAIVPAALLIGCATANLSPQLNAMHDFTIAEDGFDAVIDSADAVINSGAMAPATVAKVHTLGDLGFGYIKIGRTAITAGNAGSVEAAATALNALAPQIAALIPAKK